MVAPLFLFLKGDVNDFSRFANNKKVCFGMSIKRAPNCY